MPFSESRIVSGPYLELTETGASYFALWVQSSQAFGARQPAPTAVLERRTAGVAYTPGQKGDNIAVNLGTGMGEKGGRRETPSHKVWPQEPSSASHCAQFLRRPGWTLMFCFNWALESLRACFLFSFPWLRLTRVMVRRARGKVGHGRYATQALGMLTRTRLWPLRFMPMGRF